MAADRTPYHTFCIKCTQCKKKLTPATINEHDHKLFCPNCYEDLFNKKVRLSSVIQKMNQKTN